MPRSNSARVGYVLSTYPRVSDRAIINEIVAHEAAAVAIELFSLRPSAEQRVDEAVAQVRAPLTYLPYENLQADALWDELQTIAALLPGCWSALAEALHEDVRNAYQAAVLARMVCVRGITHLHAHGVGTAATVARLAARLAGVPFSFMAHAADLADVRPADLRRKLDDAAAVIVSSDAAAEQLRSTYGPSADHVRWVASGLDLRQLTYQPPVARPAQIVAVAWPSHGTGLADLIQACALLKQARRPFSCVIVGGALEHALRVQIAQLDVEDRVQLRGQLSHAETLDLLRSAAVFVAPSGSGGDSNCDDLPIPLLEAMALGTPCVTTGGQGIAEVPRDSDTEIIVPRADPSALAAGIARLLDDGPLRMRVARRARLLIEAQFDSAHTTQQIRECWATCHETWAASHAVFP